MDEQTEQLQRVRQHLQQVQDDPTVMLDEALLDAAIYASVPTLTPQDTQDLILQVYQLLPSLQQDPAPVVHLLSKLLEPVPLSHALALEPPVDFIAGLQVAIIPFNNLTLSLLAKADGNSARALASAHPDLFVALVELWLSTQDEGVADKTGRVLLNLLQVDLPDSSTIGMDGSVWKRIFRDKDVYERIFALTDVYTGKDTHLNTSRKTIAQARLLDWLPAVGALDWSAISQSYHPDVEAAFGLKAGQQSLLDYALLHMVDYKRDVLMHRTLMATYEALLAINPSNSLVHSPALDFLSKNGLHMRVLKYYIAPDDPSHDPLDVSFLFGPAASYTARWARIYPQDFESLKNTDIKRSILRKIGTAVSVPATRWAHSHSPSEDLHVLSSLPRTSLLSLGSSNPVLSVPSSAPNTDALNCLAAIFHGPPADHTVSFPAPSTSEHVLARPNEQDEIKAAQALYVQYLNHNPNFWHDIVSHADTLALRDQALASISLLHAVLTARWNGLAALMDDNWPAKASVVPWLLAPPRTFSNLVGGRGDAENAAYKVAAAKFDVLRVFARRLGDAGGSGDVLAVAEERVREGPWGRGQETGGKIATLEL